jgi:WD40 repeat protein
MIGKAPQPRRVIVWDVDSGKEVFARELSIQQFNSGIVQEVALSPDGKLLATSDRAAQNKSQLVKIWHITEPVAEPTTLESSAGAGNLVFSPDGTRLAGGLGGGFGNTSPNLIRLWDTVSGKPRAEVTVKNTRDIAFSPDGTRLAAFIGDSFGGQTQINLWDCTSADELKLLHTAVGPGAGPIAVGGARLLTFSTDGRRLAVWGNYGRSVRLLETATGTEHQALKSNMAIYAAAFSADGTRVVAAGYQFAAEGEAASENQAAPARYSRPGVQFAAEGAPGYQMNSFVREWAVQPIRERTPPIARRPPGTPGRYRVSSDDGSRQAIFPYGGLNNEGPLEIRILDRDGKQLVAFSEHTAPLADAPAFSPGGRLVLSRTRNGQVKVWESDSGKVRWEANLVALFGSPARPSYSTNFWYGIVFSPDGRFVTLPSPEGMKVVSTADFQDKFLVSGTAAASFPWPECFFSPDSRRLVLLESAKGRAVVLDPVKWELKVWDVDAGQEIASTSFDHQGSIGVRAPVTFSSDSRSFAVSLHRHGTVTIFDAVTGKERSVLKLGAAGGPLTVEGILFSPDGGRVVVQSSGGGAPGTEQSGPTLWDTATGKLLFRLEGHASAASPQVAFSPDGKRIATAQMGGAAVAMPTRTVKLWDAATGRELLSLKHDQQPRSRPSFSPDGHRLMLQTPDGQGPSWDATPRPDEGPARR